MATLAFDKTLALQQYEQKKEKLKQELLSLRKQGQIRLHKDTSNLFRNRSKPKNKIDVRNFNQVLSVDAQQRIAVIEGMTTYEDIVKATLPYGLVPTVVPELKSITIGGALAGCGIEASSFRYGLTPDTLLEYEILCGDGRAITCNQDNEPELYYAFPNTYGTLGYALKVIVKLIPVKKFVKLQHIHFTNGAEYFTQLKKVCLENREQEKIAYIDGVIFDSNNMYITLAEFVDEAPYVSNYKFMNIYYQSIRERKEDYLSTEDFIWRWDTDWFWCSQHFFMQNKLLRLLFGKWLLKSTAYWKMRHFVNTNAFASKLATWFSGNTESVIQDVEIPIQYAPEFYDFLQREINITPIWVCPTMSYRKNIYPFYKMDPNELYINFGFWDARKTDQEDGYYNKKIEAKVSELDGNKSLYSQIFYTENQFWDIFDKEYFLHLKQLYDPENNFGDLYQKCKNR